MTIKDFRAGLRTFLLDDGGISSAVGSVRIYPIKMPQGVKDASIVYNRISGQGDHHTQGPSGLARTRVQIDCWAQKHDDAVALANLVKGRLDGYSGPIGSGTSLVQVQGVFFDSERDLQSDESINPPLLGVSRDYFMWFEEL